MPVEECLPPIPPKEPDARSLRLTSIDPLEFARQLTLVDLNLLRAVRSDEIATVTLTGGLARLNAHGERLTGWIRSEVRPFPLQYPPPYHIKTMI